MSDFTPDFDHSLANTVEIPLDEIQAAAQSAEPFLETETEIDPWEDYLSQPEFPTPYARTRLHRVATWAGAGVSLLAVAAGVGYKYAENTHTPAQPSFTNGGLSVLNADTLPSAIPKQIKNVLPSALAVNVYDPESNSINETTGKIATAWIASGIQISKHLVITAGHVTQTGELNPQNQSEDINGINYCGTIIDDSTSGREITVKQAGTFKLYDSTMMPDVDLMETEGDEKVPDIDWKFPKVTIANRATGIGSTLYFDNYEPYANNEIARDPKGRFGPHPPRSSYPAVYGGVVDKISKNGDYEVVTGLKSYGVTRDDVTRPGASGGPVFNEEGKLVGIAVEGTDDIPTEPFELNHGMIIRGADQDGVVEVTWVQPITNRLIDKLKMILSSKPVCTYPDEG